MNTECLNLIPCALTVVYATYGSWFLITEIFCSVIPFTILFTAAVVALIHFFRIPPPDAAALETIVGKELHVEIDENDYVMTTVAHRGAGLDAPENSLKAFRMCKEKGCDAIEFDVTLTKDGVPIVFHDSTLERMADSALIVNNTKWDELKSIDISTKHSFRERFQTTNIPTLEEAVQQMLDDGQRMFIDIKDNNNKMVPVILQLFEKHPELLSRAVVSSFFPNIIYLIRKGNPKIVCSMAWRPYFRSSEYYKYPEGKGPSVATVWYKHYLFHILDMLHAWALPRFTYYLLGLSVILLHKDAVSGEVILNWRRKGVRVIGWSVNSPIEKQHFAKNLRITYLTDTLTGENTVHSISS